MESPLTTMAYLEVYSSRVSPVLSKDTTSAQQRTIMAERWQRWRFWNMCVSMQFCWGLDFVAQKY